MIQLKLTQAQTLEACLNKKVEEELLKRDNPFNITPHEKGVLGAIARIRNKYIKMNKEYFESLVATNIPNQTK